MATHLATLHAKRASIKADMEALLRAADANEGDEQGVLTADQMAAFAAMKAALEQLEASITARAMLDDMERRSPGTPLGGDARFAAFARGVSLSDAIAASLGHESRGAGRAREASQEIARQRGREPQGIFLSMGSRAAQERRDVLTSGAQGTPATGAPLIPTIVRGDLLIDALRASLVLEQLGATFLTGLTGNVSIPRTSQGTSVGWFAENAPIPDTSLAFDGVLLTIKHVGAIAEYSRNMALNSTPDIDALMRNDLMRALAVEIERAALAGTGDGVQPRGIITTPGVKSLAMGKNLTWPGVLALPAAVGTANVPMGSPGFVGTAAIRAKAMATQSVPGVASPFIMTDADTMAGYRFVATNQVPVTPATTGSGATPALSTLIFGAWENLVVGVWDALDLTTNPWSDSAYRKGNVQVRIIADLDVAVRHPEAFAFAADVTA